MRYASDRGPADGCQPAPFRGTTSPFASELAPPRRDVPATYLVLVGLPVALTAVALAIGTRLPASAGIAPTALPTSAATLRAQLSALASDLVHGQ